MKTLSEFIVERQAEYPNAKGELSGILSSIRLLAKIIHRDINKAGLTNIPVSYTHLLLLYVIWHF